MISNPTANPTSQWGSALYMELTASTSEIFACSATESLRDPQKFPLKPGRQPDLPVTSGSCPHPNDPTSDPTADPTSPTLSGPFCTQKTRPPTRPPVVTNPTSSPTCPRCDIGVCILVTRFLVMVTRNSHRIIFEIFSVQFSKYPNGEEEDEYQKLCIPFPDHYSYHCH